MIKKNLTVSVLLFSMIILFSPPMFSQQQKQAVRSKYEAPLFSFFASGSYFTPKFTDVNAVYQTIEKGYNLPQGKDFKTPYFFMTGVRFTPTSGQSLQGEFGGSVIKSPQPTATNFLQLYYTGISYLISFPLGMISPYAGGGVGYTWLNTQRTYATSIGVAQVNGQLAELHGAIGVEFFDVSGVSLAIEGRYIYGETVSPKRADLDFMQKGITGGIRVSVPLLI